MERSAECVGRVGLLLVTAQLVLSSCSQGRQAAEHDEREVVATGEVSVVRNIDTTQAATLTLQNGARLSLQANSLTEPTTIGIEQVDAQRAEQLIADIDHFGVVISSLYILTPHGTQFSKPVTLTLPVENRRGVRSASAVWLQSEDDVHWKRLLTADVASGAVELRLEHFSVVALVSADTEQDASGAEIDADGRPSPQDGGEADVSVVDDAAPSSGADAATPAGDGGSSPPNDPKELVGGLNPKTPAQVLQEYGADAAVFSSVSGLAPTSSDHDKKELFPVLSGEDPQPTSYSCAGSAYMLPVNTVGCVTFHYLDEQACQDYVGAAMWFKGPLQRNGVPVAFAMRDPADVHFYQAFQTALLTCIETYGFTLKRPEGYPAICKECYWSSVFQAANSAGLRTVRLKP